MWAGDEWFSPRDKLGDLGTESNRKAVTCVHDPARGRQNTVERQGLE